MRAHRVVHDLCVIQLPCGLEQSHSVDHDGGALLVLRVSGRPERLDVVKVGIQALAVLVLGQLEQRHCDAWRGRDRATPQVNHTEGLNREAVTAAMQAILRIFTDFQYQLAASPAG